MAGEVQGDLLEARRTENLLAPDEDVVKVRRMIARAFVNQLTAGRAAIPFRREHWTARFHRDWHPSQRELQASLIANIHVHRRVKRGH